MNLIRLREIRKSKRVSQESMAIGLGYAGKSGYCLLENGTVRMSLEKAMAIRQILKLTDTEFEEIFLDE